MAYIGKEPIVGNFQKCDAITVVNGQAAYTLQVSSTNVVPESVNHMLVSLNGILQAPTTSFKVSGSTLTFVSNLATGDVIDFVILLGNVLDLGTPSDATVTNAKLAQDIISGETALASTPADTDEFLVSDAGTLKRIDYSLIKGGITVADNWRLTASLTSNGDITSNLERVDTSGQGYLGSAMSESSGIFTFPSTGIYQVSYFMVGQTASGGDGVTGHMLVTTNNSSYAEICSGYFGSSDQKSHVSVLVSNVDVTDTANVKVKFDVSSIASGSSLSGGSTQNQTHFTFIRLGDT